MYNVMQALHNSEINASISSFFDGEWKASLGDEMNGFSEVTYAESFADAEIALHRMTMRHFPNSVYARKARGVADEMRQLCHELSRLIQDVRFQAPKRWRVPKSPTEGIGDLEHLLRVSRALFDASPPQDEPEKELTLIREAARDTTLPDAAVRAIASGLEPPTKDDIAWAQREITREPDERIPSPPKDEQSWLGTFASRLVTHAGSVLSRRLMSRPPDSTL